MIKAKSFVLEFIKKQMIARNTYTFYFKRGKFPDFIPGQYIRLTLPHKNSDDRGTSRYFTISSSPLEKKYLTITTKIYSLSPSSFKKTLLNLKPATKVNVFGPMGWFLLPEHDGLEKIFIAGGIGVTPFYSLLQTLADKKLEKLITLFVSFKTKEHAVFYEELTEIANKNSHINVVYLFSNSQENQNSFDAVFEKYISDLGKPVFYIVGSPEMVYSTKNLLLDLGIPEEKIQTEDFTGY